MNFEAAVWWSVIGGKVCEKIRMIITTETFECVPVQLCGRGWKFDNRQEVEHSRVEFPLKYPIVSQEVEHSRAGFLFE